MSQPAAKSPLWEDATVAIATDRTVISFLVETLLRCVSRNLSWTLNLHHCNLFPSFFSPRRLSEYKVDLEFDDSLLPSFYTAFAAISSRVNDTYLRRAFRPQLYISADDAACGQVTSLQSAKAFTSVNH